MNIQQKIIATTILPVITLGVMLIWIMLVPVHKTLQNEIKDALKGTANATLAAYDQNSGMYMQSKNGDIWKGSYNISKSDALLDGIKEKSGMEVTFFYGNKRIMTSAKDKNNKRILGTPAGEKIVDQVLKQGKDYFSQSVSINNQIYYGYFVPVYEKGASSPIGMVFAGTDKKEKDMINNKLLSAIVFALVIVIIFCIFFALLLASHITSALKQGIKTVLAVAAGNLEVDISLAKQTQKDELGEMNVAIAKLRDDLKKILTNIGNQTDVLLTHAEELTTASQEIDHSISHVQDVVHLAEAGTLRQTENANVTSNNILEMGKMIIEAGKEVQTLQEHTVSIEKSSNEASKIIDELLNVNEKVKDSINKIEIQTYQTEQSSQEIGKITAFISSVANQVNLLSFNATIEAARIGAQGKGFTIVALELKKLGEQAETASKNIDQIIQNLITNSAASVQIMEDVKEIVAEQDNSIGETNKIFLNVLDGLDVSAQTINSMAQKTQLLENTRSGLIQFVQEMHTIAEQNAVGIKKTFDSTTAVAEKFHEVGSAASDLKRIANELAADMEIFTH